MAQGRLRGRGRHADRPPGPRWSRPDRRRALPPRCTRWDFLSGSIPMSHMGEGTWRIAREDRSGALIKRPMAIGGLDDPSMLRFEYQPAPPRAMLVAARGRALPARGRRGRDPRQPPASGPGHALRALLARVGRRACLDAGAARRPAPPLLDLGRHAAACRCPPSSPGSSSGRSRSTALPRPPPAGDDPRAVAVAVAASSAAAPRWRSRRRSWRHPGSGSCEAAAMPQRVGRRTRTMARAMEISSSVIAARVTWLAMAELSSLASWPSARGRSRMLPWAPTTTVPSAANGAPAGFIVSPVVVVGTRAPRRRPPAGSAHALGVMWRSRRSGRARCDARFHLTSATITAAAITARSSCIASTSAPPRSRR